MKVRQAGCAIAGVMLLLPSSLSNQASSLRAQVASTATSAARQIGTIQAMDATSLTLTTDKGEKISVALSGETKVVELPAGSTDLKAAQPGAMTDLAVGDRVLAIGAPGEATGTLMARRLVLMKSTDIAKRREAEQAGWQHGTGGIVSAVDPASGVVTMTAGTHTVKIVTTPSTIVRRYAPTSARFEDATKSSLGEIRPGDQLRARGERSTDGSVAADEIVSGSFRHLSGTIQSIDSAAGQVTVKDVKTQKPVTLSVTDSTSIHQLPPEVAARFAARAKTGSSAPAGGTPSAAGQTSPAGSEGAAGHTGSGGDLSQVVSRLPAVRLADLKLGGAVMAVGGDGTGGTVAAVTILAGVEPILAASPGGGAEMALSPWSMGGGGGEAGGGSQ